MGKLLKCRETYVALAVLILLCFVGPFMARHSDVISAATNNLFK